MPPWAATVWERVGNWGRIRESSRDFGGRGRYEFGDAGGFEAGFCEADCCAQACAACSYYDGAEPLSVFCSHASSVFSAEDVLIVVVHNRMPETCACRSRRSPPLRLSEIPSSLLAVQQPGIFPPSPYTGRGTYR